MKARKYQIKIYGGSLDYRHHNYSMQDILYFPGKGILGYAESVINFFSDEPKRIAQVKRDGKYVGKIEVPDKLVSALVSAGKSLNKAEASFKKRAGTLIEKIREE